MKKGRKEGRKDRREKKRVEERDFFEASITRFLHATWLLSSEAKNKQLLSNSCKQLCELFEIWKTHAITLKVRLAQLGPSCFL